ncbi:hypothetical protein CWE15_04400 [Aliidiomarina taiwanensis]|uniref:Uncharacterized protein n=1 Tax=Aliidiomarina taiwanensis TaxID=946228 RepID=A0A432X721_9GAMM|nr:hypothetical protein [Aliidiomarina taiwanensis]RUO42659.1 hypothetical protein CWE15_04400 [Aliidiomarina taiwanensis]
MQWKPDPLSKWFIFALVMLTSVVTVLLILIAFYFIGDYPETYGELRAHWLNVDYSDGLTIDERVAIELLSEKGVIHSRDEYASALTGYYSTIISTLITFIGLLAIVQFGFIISQAKETASRHARETIEGERAKFNFDAASKLQELADGKNRSLKSELQDELEELRNEVNRHQEDISSLTAIIKSLTDDPEQDEESNDDSLDLSGGEISQDDDLKKGG